MTNITQTAQDLEPGALVSLFILDLTKVGGNVLYFVQGAETNSKIKFGGQVYEPVDCEFEGMETTGAGALPTPTIRLNNTDGMAQTAINTFGDLLGCEVQRIRTFARHLDDHEDPDSTAFFGPDIFQIERKVTENSVFVEWELSAAIDQAGKMIPGRSVLRNTCLARYRRYAGSGTFNYAKAQCPYTGSNYFDENDQATTAGNDKPSRTVNCCKLRFGKNKPLPFWGFPGVMRPM